MACSSGTHSTLAAQSFAVVEHISHSLACVMEHVPFMYCQRPANSPDSVGKRVNYVCITFLFKFATKIIYKHFQLLCSVVIVAQAQNYPPRLSIPGAVPVPGPLPQRQPVLRVRRPGTTLRQQQNVILPSVTPRVVLEEPRPVTEPAEDEQPDAFLPNLLREQQLAHAQQSQFQQAAAAFLNGQQQIEPAPPVPHLLQHEDSQPTAILPAPPRFAERPSAQLPAPSNRPAFNDFGIGRFESAQRFGLERPVPTIAAQPPPPTPQRVAVIRTRPANAVRPEAPAPLPVARPRPKPIQSRPLIDQNQLQEEPQGQQQQRRQRPVAQTIRKWRDENEDGSITWGYENDDGSFKEELIGTDCITK